MWALLVVMGALGLGYVVFRAWLAWWPRALLHETNVNGLLTDGVRLQRALERGDFAALSTTLENAASDWSRVYEVYELLCTAKSLSQLKSWCEREPQNPVAKLALGVAALDAAWQARTGRRARDVAESAWQSFASLSGEARHALAQAAELAPDDPTPWAFLVKVAMGEGDQEAVLGALDEANRRDAGHYFAHDNAMFALTEKWLGSHRASLDLVRNAAAQLPPGAPVHGLVIAAHINVWQYRAFFESDNAKALAYLSKKKVQRECDLALARSVDHADHTACAASNRVQNDAAFYYHLIGDHDAARERFHQIGQRWTLAPWGWGPGLTAARAFRNARLCAEP